MKTHSKLKADRPLLDNYPHTLPDYRHTDKHLRLGMVLIALYCSAIRGGHTDGWTDATKYIISLTSRSIINRFSGLLRAPQGIYEAHIHQTYKRYVITAITLPKIVVLLNNGLKLLFSASVKTYLKTINGHC